MTPGHHEYQISPGQEMAVDWLIGDGQVKPQGLGHVQIYGISGIIWSCCETG